MWRADALRTYAPDLNIVKGSYFPACTLAWQVHFEGGNVTGNNATAGDGGAVCFTQGDPMVYLSPCVNDLVLSLGGVGELGLVTPGQFVSARTHDCADCFHSIAAS